MNSYEFLKAAKEFAIKNMANVTISHSGVTFTVRYVMSNSTHVNKAYLDFGGLTDNRPERMFHALFSEAGND